MKLRNFLMLPVLVGLAFVSVYASPALAQAVAPVTTPVPVVASTTIDLSTYLTALLGTVGSILSVGALFGVKYVLAKLKLNSVIQDSTLKADLDQAIEAAVHFAVSKLSGADWLKVDTKNAAIAEAVTFALDHVDSILVYFGYDSAKLSALVEAKLAAAYPALVASATQPAAEPGVA